VLLITEKLLEALNGNNGCHVDITSGAPRTSSKKLAGSRNMATQIASELPSNRLLAIYLAPATARDSGSYEGADKSSSCCPADDQGGPMPSADVARATGCGRPADCRSASRPTRMSDQDSLFAPCTGPCRDLPDILPVDGLQAAAWSDGEGSVVTLSNLPVTALDSARPLRT